MSTLAQSTLESKSARLSSSNLLLMTAVLTIVDFCVLSIAVAFGFRLWAFVNPRIPPLHPAMLLAPVSALVAFAFSGLYPGIGLTSVVHIRRTLRGVTLTYLLLTAAMFLSKSWWADSRGAFFCAWILSLLLAPCGRWFCEKFLSGNSWWGAPVLLVGAGETAQAIVRSLRDNQCLGYRPVACVDDMLVPVSAVEGVPVVGSLAEAPYWANVYRTNYAIVALPGMSRDALNGYLRLWCKVFPKIIIVPDLAGVASLWTEPRDLGGLLGLEMQQKLLNGFNWRLKRLLDLIVSSVAIFLTIPFVLLCAAWVCATSPGPALYFQEREGRNGRIIRVWKLRTMYVEAEQMLQKHLAEDAQARTEWETFCKLKRDPRVLPGIGRFLRRTSIDELPQLWNVLKGEMSLVGPRPFPIYHNERFDPEFRTLRTQVTPGLTGLWQVGPRSDGNLSVQLSLDTYYIQNWSLWLDLYIVIRTMRAIFIQEGSY